MLFQHNLPLQWFCPTPDLINFVQLLFCDFIYIENKSPTTSDADPVTHRTARDGEVGWLDSIFFYLSYWTVFLRVNPIKSYASPLASLWRAPFLQDSKDSSREFYRARMTHQGTALFLIGSKKQAPSKPHTETIRWWGGAVGLAIKPRK